MTNLETKKLNTEKPRNLKPNTLIWHWHKTTPDKLNPQTSLAIS